MVGGDSGGYAFLDGGFKQPQSQKPAEDPAKRAQTLFNSVKRLLDEIAKVNPQLFEQIKEAAKSGDYARFANVIKNNKKEIEEIAKKANLMDKLNELEGFITTPKEQSNLAVVKELLRKIYSFQVSHVAAATEQNVGEKLMRDYNSTQNWLKTVVDTPAGQIAKNLDKQFEELRRNLTTQQGIQVSNILKEFFSDTANSVKEQYGTEKVGEVLKVTAGCILNHASREEYEKALKKLGLDEKLIKQLGDAYENFMKEYEKFMLQATSPSQLLSSNPQIFYSVLQWMIQKWEEVKNVVSQEWRKVFSALLVSGAIWKLVEIASPYLTEEDKKRVEELRKEEKVEKIAEAYCFC